jgi:N-acetylglutamate synthase-like GNAT family acetyltransferase
MINKLNIIYSQANSGDELAIFDLLKKLEGDRSKFDIARFYVAKNNDNLIGCVRTKMFDGGCLELASLAVNKNYQGQGIGSRLVEELLLKEVTRPIFILTELNKEGFYKKFDFNIIKPIELPNEFKKEYDRIINLPFAKNLKVIAMVVR